MSWVPKQVRPSHREMLRLSVLGWSNTAIAEHLHYSSVAVGCVLRSPLAQNEMARMQAAADKSVLDVPERIDRLKKLEDAADDALSLNHGVINNPMVPIGIRVNVGKHILDRVIFDKNDDSDKHNYRDILRQLDRIERGGNTVVVNNQVNIEG